MSKKTTRIEELHKRLEALPGKRFAAQQNDRYRTLNQKAKNALSAASEVSTKLSLITGAFEYFTGKGALAKLRDAADRSQNALARLKASQESILDEKTESDIVVIGESTSAAKQALNDEWRNMVLAKFQTRAAIAGAMSRVLPREGPRVEQQAKRGVQLCQTLPANLKDARDLAGSLRDLDTALEKLGMKGEVGAFLRACISDGASLALANKPEVREFLAAHSLEQNFKVRLS